LFDPREEWKAMNDIKVTTQRRKFIHAVARKESGFGTKCIHVLGTEEHRKGSYIMQHKR